MAKLEKTIDDLEGTLPFNSFLSFPIQDQSFLLYWAFSSAIIIIYSKFPSFFFVSSLWSAEPLHPAFLPTCRRVVHSEAEIQGYQRGAGSRPQWYEYLVKRWLIVSLLFALLLEKLSHLTVLSLLSACFHLNPKHNKKTFLFRLTLLFSVRCLKDQTYWFIHVDATILLFFY